MYWLTDAIEAIRDFMGLGGPVLKAIAVAIFLMWVLIVERILYFRSTMRDLSRRIHDDWESRPERRSWHAHQIREMMISRFSQEVNRGIPMIQTFVALCPLLGLLGTVTGMIRAFGVVAVAGMNEPHAITGGVAEALIATAAGLLIAILTLIPYNYFSNRAERELEEIEYYGSRLELVLAEQEGKN